MVDRTDTGGPRLVPHQRDRSERERSEGKGDAIALVHICKARRMTIKGHNSPQKLLTINTSL